MYVWMGSTSQSIPLDNHQKEKTRSPHDNPRPITITPVSQSPPPSFCTRHSRRSLSCTDVFPKTHSKTSLPITLLRREPIEHEARMEYFYVCRFTTDCTVNFTPLSCNQGADRATVHQRAYTAPWKTRPTLSGTPFDGARKDWRGRPVRSLR